jgi:NADH dehydrogenase FAD-containing subunit
VASYRSGRLLVDEYLHVKAPDAEGVWAVGDCAAFETNPLPATAQGAEQEGKYLAQYHHPLSPLLHSTSSHHLVHALSRGRFR